jgi:hypothetical protein
MKAPSTTREALIVEALGDAAKLIRQVEALKPALNQSRQAMADAHMGLARQLAAFEAQVVTLTERAKVQTAKHIIARTEEAARRSIELQRQAMVEAARVALGTELGAALQQIRSSLQPPAQRPEPWWEPWLTYAAVASAASAFTCSATIFLSGW